MHHLLKHWALFTVVLFVVGCGKWPPVVDSKGDIAKLPPSTDSIRARALADADIPSLARFQQLRILDFRDGYAVTNANITDRGLAALATLKLPQLETLTIGYTTNITDAGLVQIARMHSVRWLSLMVCPSITDAGLPSLLTMTNLTALDLRGCTGITDEGVLLLARKTNWGDHHVRWLSERLHRRCCHPAAGSAQRAGQERRGRMELSQVTHPIIMPRCGHAALRERLGWGSLRLVVDAFPAARKSIHPTTASTREP